MLTPMQISNRLALRQTMQRVIEDKLPFNMVSIERCIIGYHEPWASLIVTRYAREFVSESLGLPEGVCINVFALNRPDPTSKFYEHNPSEQRNAAYHALRMCDAFDAYPNGVP